MTIKPKFRALVNVADKVWDEIGEAWENEIGNISVHLKYMPVPKDGEISFLLVST
jgi:hypothetical protein